MRRHKIVILDMQPITPAVGGGRQRLLGLYHGLGDNIEAVYVGSYDWPGEAHRDHWITTGLREICIPLSPEHHSAAEELRLRMDGRVMIDMAFSEQVHLSPEYLATAEREIRDADVVVFSHPWCFPPLLKSLRQNQLVVYDSQNVETLLRVTLHGDLVQAESILLQVAAAEASLLERANLVYCCSEEEVEQYFRIFEASPSKLRIAPNGAFTASFSDGLFEKRQSAREGFITRHGDHQNIAIFMGSQYGPNVDAAKFIAQTLAPKHPSIYFVLVGGVHDGLAGIEAGQNVCFTGVVSEEEKWQYLLAADIALNPMAVGAGTNVKMFDYLVVGLPVLSTDVGARGIARANTRNREVVITDRDSFSSELNDMMSQPISNKTRIECHNLVAVRFGWEKISKLLGGEFYLHMRGIDVPRPKVLQFSTWGIRCGIAEHSKYLADALKEAGADVLMFGNSMRTHEATGPEGDLEYPVTRGWNWDNVYWRDSRLDRELFERIIRRFCPNVVVLQHHTAFLSSVDYAWMSNTARELGAKVFLESHDSTNLIESEVDAICQAGATLWVHSAREKEKAGRKWHDEIMVRPLPIKQLAVDVVNVAERRHIEGTLVIGGFGFFREYKGVDITIRAIAILKEHFKNIRYHGWHSTYPGEEDSEYIRKCRALIAELDLENEIHIESGYVPMDRVFDSLRNCDLIALPYSDSDEGASAAANTVISTGVPLVVSSSNIFSQIREICVVVQKRDPSAYADTVIRLMRDKESLRELKERVREWVAANNYSAAAAALLRP